MLFTPIFSDKKCFEHTKDCIRTLDKLGSEFRNALGKCNIFRSLSALLPSRFASTNPNGVWDYSPFFCGAGLAEGLELLYRSVMALWEGMPEPMLILHLHNMLGLKGYLEKPISPYDSLGRFFNESFFSDGEPPTSDFLEAFRSQRDKAFSRKAMLQEKNKRRVEGKATRARDLLNLTPLHLFTLKFALVMYGSADWDPDRIPDSDVDVISSLAMARLSQTKRVRDPLTCAWRFEETGLVKRMRDGNVDDSFVMALDPIWELLTDERQAQAAQMTFSLPDGSAPRIRSRYDTDKPSEKEDKDENPDKYEYTAERMLKMLAKDIRGDICGGDRIPLSNLTYLSITVQMLYFFEVLEAECRSSSSATVRRLFAGNAKSDDGCKMPSNKRLHVALRALGGEDEELLKAIAIAFQKCEALFAYSRNTYWDLDDEEKTRRASQREDGTTRLCCVM